jgi:3-oxoacyl-(acyl-carrier-protein) synthase
MAYDDAGLPGLRAARGFAACVASGASAVAEFPDVLERLQGQPMRRRDASTVVESIGHTLTNYAAVDLGLQGQAMTLGSGCASGVDAIQWVCAQIAGGHIIGALAGAADAPLATSVHAAWGKLGWLSRWTGLPAHPLRSYDALSDGSVLGEGAGMYVLEDLEQSRARGAHIYAEVLGYGSGSDGLDLRTVDSSGASLQAAMRDALSEARLGPGEIDHVNAHGGGCRGTTARRASRTARCSAGTRTTSP